MGRWFGGGGGVGGTEVGFLWVSEKWVEFRVLVGPVCIKTSFLWSNMLICDRGRAWNN